MLAAGCSTPPAEVPEPAATSSGQSSGCGTSQSAYLTDDQEEVTYYKDILPILESSRDGIAHKCTTCHSDYLLPHRVARVEEVERIIASVEARRMPPKGFDPVRPEYVEKFKIWRLTGFKIGSESDKRPLQPPRSSSGSSAGVNSSNCK